MARGFIDAVTGQQQLAEVARREALRAQVALDSSQDTSNKIGRQYSQIPWAQPGTNYSAAQANATAQTQKAIADASGRQAADLTDVHSPSKKSWWERNIYGKIKTASRWTFATMQAVPDLAQNAASIAGTILLTEAAVIEIKDKNDNNNNAGMMPGMY